MVHDDATAGPAPEVGLLQVLGGLQPAARGSARDRTYTRSPPLESPEGGHVRKVGTAFDLLFVGRASSLPCKGDSI